MKLVIDIPEEEFNEIEPFLNGETIKGGFNLFKALEIIKNGMPFPIDEIQTEIKQQCGCDTALKIIEKHLEVK